MEIKVIANIQNLPTKPVSGFEVATVVDGMLWHFGTYPEWERAATAAAGHEDRVILEVTE